MSRSPARGMSFLLVIAILSCGPSESAETVTVTIQAMSVAGMETEVGRVTFQDSKYGLLVTPDFTGMTAGPHGVHVHENPDCGPMTSDGVTIVGGAAGGHYDPENTRRHGGPYGDGHLGDLPNIIVEQDGRSSIPVLAPRVHVADIRNRALMIHAGADHYDGHAHHHHGKGGMRMYCGVID